MAKASKGDTTTVQDKTRKQRKKQARQEARLMLRLEQARKDVQKAEKKLEKAQANLEASSAQVETLENKLTQMRASNHNDAHNGSSQREVQADELGILTVFTTEGAVPFIELPITQAEISSTAVGEQADSMDQEWRPTEATVDSSPAETEAKSVPSSEQEAESAEETVENGWQHSRLEQSEDNQ